jgi:prolyl oligopeptidase
MAVIQKTSAATLAAALLAATCFLAPTLTMAQPAQAESGVLPKAPVKNMQDTFFGTTVDDPYRQFENKSDPVVAAWMKAHSDATYATLNRIGGRTAMLERIKKFDDAVESRVTSVQRTDSGIYFYEKRGVKDNQFKLYMRQGTNGEEKLLADPEEAAKKTGKPHAINYYAVSKTGRYVAYGLSQAGSEDAVLHVLDTRSGKAVGAPIERAQFGSPDFSPDEKTLIFNRLQELKPGMPETEKFQKSTMVKLSVGAPVSQAMPVFGSGTPGVQIGAAEIPIASMTYDKRWVMGMVLNGTQRDIALYAAPYAGVMAGKPQWRRLVVPQDKVTAFSYFDNSVYLMGYGASSRFAVSKLDLNKRQTAGQASTVVAPSDRVLTGIATASDGLYINAREGNVKRLLKLAYKADAKLEEIKLPVSGAFDISFSSPEQPGVMIDLQSWTQARQIYQVGGEGTVMNTGLQPQGPFDAPKDVTATEVMVKSHDGAMVPLSIIHKKDVKLDGTNPTILYGYASYGITEEPFFSIGRLAWMESGGIFAVANPRGSSVFGQDWYKAGFQATKPNTWKDFIACAEYLVANKYTSSAKLGILGGSAGGITVGRAMTERPDLFAAAVPAVGVLDTVRAETTPNGVPNIPEFGSVKTEAGFKALLAMSTYHNIKEKTAYPAVMLTHGVNDPRVEVWQSTKTAARLEAATSSGKPVLMRLDYDAGHGVGNTKAQQNAERADIYSFFMWQFKQPGYELKDSVQ